MYQNEKRVMDFFVQTKKTKWLKKPRGRIRKITARKNEEKS